MQSLKPWIKHVNIAPCNVFALTLQLPSDTQPEPNGCLQHITPTLVLAGTYWPAFKSFAVGHALATKYLPMNEMNLNFISITHLLYLKSGLCFPSKRNEVTQLYLHLDPPSLV